MSIEIYIDNQVCVTYDKYSVPNKYSLLILTAVLALSGAMIFFIFSGVNKPSNNPNLQNSLSSDPLASPIRKNATAQNPKHVITIESRDPRIKPEVINVNQLNDELTKIGFWDKETILFSSPQKKTGILKNKPVTGATVNSLQITIDLNKNSKEINPDPNKGSETLETSSIRAAAGIEEDAYSIIFTLHPYMLNFDYGILGSRLSYILLENAWNSTQHSPIDSATGHPTGNLYALKTLQNTPEFSYIRLRK